MEITSPFDGVIKELLVNEGQVAKVGEGLCLIEVDEEGAVEDTSSQSQDTVKASPTPSETPAAPSPTKRRPHPLDPNYVPPSQPETAKPSIKQEDILATPSVRHFARKNGVDLCFVAPGSGKDGRVERKDVEAYMAPPAQVKEEGGRETKGEVGDIVVELGRTRYGMWKAMTKVQILFCLIYSMLTRPSVCRAWKYLLSGTLPPYPPLITH